jgi:diadenosine tetraphosphate (Ap4A) HIT family hydrolase
MHEKNMCCICSQIAGDESNDLIARTIESRVYLRRVAFESEYFAVIPSLGPLAPGHSLLCPKQHYKSFASLPLIYEEDYNLMKVRLSEVLQSLYGMPVHCFEHGSAKEAIEPLCTVEHAHLHFIPTAVDILECLDKNFGWEPVGGSLLNLHRVSGGLEYLYYEAPDGSQRLAKAEIGTFESQYMRKVFAHALGKGSLWNWREVPAPSETHKAYELIKQSIRASIP